MSAATTLISAHLPHTAHPTPLREQAFTLHCQGLRSPAISEALGVPQRTIRAWITAALDDLKDDHHISRREQLLLAVERQHALTVAAWQQFETETAARGTLLDATLAACRQSTAATPGGDASTASTAAAAVAPSAPPTLPRLPASTPAPRYLSLILQAHKETNRLLGLYTLAKLDLLTAETAPIPCAASDIESPAESATAPAEVAAGRQPANPCPPLASASNVSSPRIPAESATASTTRPPVSPLSSRERLPPKRSLLEREGGTGGRGEVPHLPKKARPWMM